MASKKTDAQFYTECEAFAKERGIILVEGQTYAGVHHYYTWKCKHDGHVWQAPFARINQGKGCPTCGAKQAGNKNAINEAEFLERLKQRNKLFDPISYVSGYAGSSKKCMFTCDCCGNEWQTIPTSVYRGVGCPECNKN